MGGCGHESYPPNPSPHEHCDNRLLGDKQAENTAGLGHEVLISLSQLKPLELTP